MNTYRPHEFGKLKYQRRNKLKAIAKKKPWLTTHNLGRRIPVARSEDLSTESESSNEHVCI